MSQDLVLSPSDFINMANQTLEFAFPYVYIEGELANYKISNNKWLYFDLKDQYAKIRCFAGVYALPGPLQDGMMLKVSGQPRMHPQFSFSFNVQTIQTVGKGSIKKAYLLLKAQLQNEGLFEITRKRKLIYPPRKIVLVTSRESAAYTDFIKILNDRWPFLTVELYNTQVQGENAHLQIVENINLANKQPELADVLVVIRGGGSQDDLSAFNDERVVRQIAASRIPTLVAIGHEVDEMLAELVSDKRASTPSNAAEVLVPDRFVENNQLNKMKRHLLKSLLMSYTNENNSVQTLKLNLVDRINRIFTYNSELLNNYKKILSAYNPNEIIKRGYCVVRQNNKIILSAEDLNIKNLVTVEMNKGNFEATIKTLQIKKE